ncbi:MAG: hypothetical protein Q4E22_05800 [Coriobacteriia bacterium]|nr:hypothetical protein [Coriobacteriia bacterium]
MSTSLEYSDLDYFYDEEIGYTDVTEDFSHLSTEEINRRIAEYDEMMKHAKRLPTLEEILKKYQKK